MPTKTKRDEEKWEKAKEIAAESGHKEDYAYIMGIYKRMKPDYKFKSGPAAKAADGSKTVPKKSPNGRPVQKPDGGGGSGSWGRWASAEQVSTHFLRKADYYQVPTPTSSARNLKRQGLMPVDEFFGEVIPRPNRTIVMQGELLQDRKGDVLYFVGLNERGKALLAKTEKEYLRLRGKFELLRLPHMVSEKRFAFLTSKEAAETQRCYELRCGHKSRHGAWIPGEPDDPNSWEFGHLEEDLRSDDYDDEGSQVPPARDSFGNELE